MAEPLRSKRERQIMDVVFQLGEASAADVHARMPDPPTYTAVRTMIRLLEEKGQLQHRQEGRKYIYTTCRSCKSEGRSAINRVLKVFFSGSLEDAVAAHLSDPDLSLDADDLKRLRAVIDEADSASRPAAKPKSKRRSR